MGFIPNTGWLPEWSKGSDSSSDVFVLVGSNPTPVIFYFLIRYSSKRYYGFLATYFAVNTAAIYYTLHLLPHYYLYLYKLLNTFLCFLPISQTCQTAYTTISTLFFIFSYSSIPYFQPFFAVLLNSRNESEKKEMSRIFFYRIYYHIFFTNLLVWCS